jgi:putative tricarboxylic transport membrane protein
VRLGEMIISGGMALLAIVFYVLGNFTQQINPDDPGPAFYPRILSILLFAFSFVQIILSWRKKKEVQDKDEVAPEKKESFSYKIILGTLVLSVIYGFVFDKVSYLLTTTCFLLAMMLLGGVRKWLILLSVAVCYSVGTYFLFGEVLMVPLK